jgi:pimeloyl-ACP methyl ester carboxylesterase
MLAGSSQVCEMTANKHLPRILCLHGGGSSAEIFRIQSRHIRYALRHRFRFVFADAPFESSAGPGILPVFEEIGPYYRWYCGVSASSAFDITGSKIAAERRTVREYLEKLLSDEDGEPFVGVMGFSQGTMVATGLLLDQQQRQDREGLPHLKFAVLLCGTYPPLLLTDPIPPNDTPLTTIEGSESTAAAAPPLASSGGELSPDKIHRSDNSFLSPPPSYGKMSGAKSHYLRIPSVHAHGLKDPWLSEGRSLLTNCYEARYATLVEFQGGHHIPLARQDIDELSRAIIGAYEAPNTLGCPM